MRLLLTIALLSLLAFASCQRHEDPLIGRWTVDKVNVEFDEYQSTPEMVKQYGELEQDNVIEISTDSLLVFVSQGDTLRGRCSLKGEQLYRDAEHFAQFRDGKIITESATPLGKITVCYKK
ncbi:MAG: hypothetical protein K6A28_04345 [Bacteroidales bacterium]|nr:hypothetical protein [Bacteroidales bacterium]